MRIRLKHDRLAEELAKRQVSQNRWAQKLRLTSGHLSQLVNGNRKYPSARTRRKLLEGLGLPFEALFEIEVGRAEPPWRAGPVPFVELQRRYVRVPVYKVRPVRLQQKGNGLMQGALHDVRYGLRMLAASRGFTAIAVLVLALGIGANTVIFGIVNAVLLDPLPYEEPDRLVKLWGSRPDIGMNQFGIAYPNFADWRAQNRVFEQMAAWGFLGPPGVSLTGSGEPMLLQAVAVTAGFFDVLGARPMVGRTFLPEADDPATSRRVVLSHRLWQQRFGADPELVGGAILLNGEPYTVVGVMPADFWFEPQSGLESGLRDPVDAWIPLAGTPSFAQMHEHRGAHWLRAIARLRPGVTVAQAREEMQLIARRLEEANPRMNEGWSVYLVSWYEELVGGYRVTLLTLLGAVGFVLLIACVNVANLLLARSTARQRETAIRVALGAGRFRLIRQFLTESLLLAVPGAALGVLLAWGGIRLVVVMAPPEVPRIEQAALDMQVLGFTLGLALLTSLIFGLAPALYASAPRLGESLKDGGTRLIGFGPQRLRDTMVVAEIALALVLLVGAGLMIRSFLGLRAFDSGFDGRGVLTTQVSVPSWKYTEDSQVVGLFQQILERIEGLPGVESAGIASNLPRSGYSRGAFYVDDRPRPPREETPTAQFIGVSPDYFKAMGIPLLRGREFDDRDASSEQGATIISASLADGYLSDAEPIARRIELLAATPELYEIVGIVGDLRDPFSPQQIAAPTAGIPALYFPFAREPDTSMSLVVRTESDALSLASLVRSEIRAADPDVAMSAFMTMEQVLDETIAQPHFYTRLLSIFGGIALLLVAVGVYGILSYSVAQRTFEIGVRMALGAGAKDVVSAVVRKGLALALLGTFIGVGLALALTRLVSSLLFGVTPTDPTTFAAVVAILVTVAFFACYFPARRAANIDPVEALR